MTSTITATVIADSISSYGKRITTLQLKYPRFIHSEFMTHRTFCLAGDSRLDFELPSGGIYSMTLREFSEKWHNGACTGKSPRHNGEFLSLDATTVYSAKQVADSLGFARALNVNAACRAGAVGGAFKHKGVWFATGANWNKWRESTGTRRFSIRSRLQQMRIRQVDEGTFGIRLSTIVNCVASGEKPVFRLTAGNYSVVASKDHRILTSEGWKTLEQIQPGKDAVCTYRYGTGAKEDRFKKIDGVWVAQWARTVKDQIAIRQNHLCHVSGNPLEKSFHIHHVIPRHERPDLAFDLGNVVAVNADEHRRLHEKQGWQTGVPLSSQFCVVDGIFLEGNQDTYDLEIAGDFPNFFADGIVVHNSRNAASSRAIPVVKMIEQVRNDPALPIHWGLNQPGMQASKEHAEPEKAQRWWWLAAESAAEQAERLNELGLHKQIVNRVLEPFQWMHTIVTATEWDNFFDLRCHPDAQPEFQALANAIRTAMDESSPVKRASGTQWASSWHLPYVSDDERANLHPHTLPKISAARCARVSYLKHDGTIPSIEDDMALFERLVGSKPLHASPIEHQACAASSVARSRNFLGWHQYRDLFESGTMK